jgi:hypothetical protein
VNTKFSDDKNQRQIIALLKYEVEQGVLEDGKAIAVKKLYNLMISSTMKLLIFSD